MGAFLKPRLIGAQTRRAWVSRPGSVRISSLDSAGLPFRLTVWLALDGVRVIDVDVVRETVERTGVVRRRLRSAIVACLDNLLSLARRCSASRALFISEYLRTGCQRSSSAIRQRNTPAC